MPTVDRALLQLDVEGLRRFLWHELPARPSDQPRGEHELAWELGERFAEAGLPEQAALCRSSTTHEVLAVWRWTRTFPQVPEAFWTAARDRLGPRPPAPPRVALGLASTRGVLEAVGDGLATTGTGGLPAAVVQALDDRFRWSDEFPWMRREVGSDIPPLRFLHEHLTAQGLLARDGDRLVVTARGRAALADDGRLWAAVVAPAPRWTREFDRDVLGVLGASLLRSRTFTPGRVAEEVTHVLAAKWRRRDEDGPSSVYDGVSPVVQAWYQLGVPLGWWDTGRGPADRYPNVFGAAAATAVFRAAPTVPADGPRG